MTTLNITTWFTLGTAGMALGTLALAWGYTQIPSESRRNFTTVVAVPLIATVAYGLMALDIGAVTSARGQVLYVARYVDWLLTTPLHVAYLGLLVGASKQTIGKLAGLMGATIVFGLAGGLVATPLNLVLFALGGVTFAGVGYLLYTDVDDRAHEGDGQLLSLFQKLRIFVFVLWSVYPVIWLLSGPGFVLMDAETASLVTTYIDVVAKIGFGLIAFNGLQTVYGAGESVSPESGATTAD